MIHLKCSECANNVESNRKMSNTISNDIGNLKNIHHKCWKQSTITTTTNVYYVLYIWLVLIAEVLKRLAVQQTESSSSDRDPTWTTDIWIGILFIKLFVSDAQSNGTEKIATVSIMWINVGLGFQAGEQKTATPPTTTEKCLGEVILIAVRWQPVSMHIIFIHMNSFRSIFKKNRSIWF